MRYSFLWSLWNLSGAIIKQHIVLQTPPQLTKYHSFIDQSFPHDPHYQERKLIRFTNEMPSIKVEKGATIVPLGSVYQNREKNFPSHHLFARSHYLQFSNSLYASLMDYAEFCKMEDKLAHIVNHYLEDKKNNWLIMMDDTFLMGSIRGYGTRASIVKQTTWITLEKTGWNDMLLVDMGADHPHI